MSKKFKGKPCIYCTIGKSINSGDHIFPRKLFLEKNRDNLPKVPACKNCNEKKSRLEHYLLTILPFGASHPDAKENLTKLVPPRLATNLSLQRKLYMGKSIEFIKNENNIFEPRLTIEFDINQLFELFNYITKALANFHFNLLLDQDHFIETTESNAHLLKFFSGASKNNVANNLGNRTVIYRGIQAQDKDFITMWEYEIYGGLQIKGLGSGNIISTTGPNRIIDNVRRRRMFGI